MRIRRAGARSAARHALFTLVLRVGCGAALTAPWRAAYPQRAPAEPFAVIVNRSVPVTDVSLSQLRDIFRGEQQFWPKHARITLVVGAHGTVGRTVALADLYEMSEDEYRRYWIGKLFRDDVLTGPRVAASSTAAKRLTAATPGAIAIIPMSDVDETVRVLTIDGRSPDDPNYRLGSRGRDSPP